MARPKGWTNKDVERTRLMVLECLRKQSNGQSGWFSFNTAQFALDRGIDRCTTQRAIRKLSEQGKIEYESKNGVGYMIRIAASPAQAPESAAETVSEPTKANTYRKCPRCSTAAPDASARFCWKCGSSLLSEKELLKEAFDRLFPKIARLSGDSAEANEIMTVIGRVGEMAFGGGTDA